MRKLFNWIEDLWLDFRAVISWYPIMKQMRTWSYNSVIRVMIEHVERNIKASDFIKDDDERDMRRFVELAKNIIEDDYPARCGYKYDNYRLIDVSPGIKRIEEIDPEIAERNRNAIVKSIALEEMEWIEFCELFKKFRGWH